MFINISFKSDDIKKYSSAAFSNLFPYDFSLDGIECASMEGFLRSLTVDDSCSIVNKNAKEQICKLSGINAYKIRYQLRDWRKTQTVFWKGKEIKRDGAEYQELLTRAYDSLFENDLFKLVLSSLNDDDEITHSIGSHDKKETLLTGEEYIYQLNRLRKRLKEDKD